MTTIALHQPPQRLPVVRQQLRSVGIQLRWPGILLLAGLVTIGVIVVGFAASEASRRPDVFGFPLEAAQTMPAWFIGLFAAAALWQRDEPSRRGYHLAMPVRATEHTIIRVFAGWAWLMVGVAGYLALLVALAFAVAAVGGGHVTSQFTAWEWVAPFAAGTMCYLLATIPLIASEKPIVWLIGPPALIALILSLPFANGASRGSLMYRLVTKILAGPFNPSAPFFPVYYFPRIDFKHLPAVDLRTSVLATVFWMAVAMAGVWLAARRNPRATR
jgi:hypothetical protein